MQHWLSDWGGCESSHAANHTIRRIRNACTREVAPEMVKSIPICYHELTNRNAFPMCSMHLLTSNQSSKTSNTVVCSSSKSIFTDFRFLREFSSTHTPPPNPTPTPNHIPTLTNWYVTILELLFKDPWLCSCYVANPGSAGRMHRCCDFIWTPKACKHESSYQLGSRREITSIVHKLKI